MTATTNQIGISKLFHSQHTLPRVSKDSRDGSEVKAGSEYFKKWSVFSVVHICVSMFLSNSILQGFSAHSSRKHCSRKEWKLF